MKTHLSRQNADPEHSQFLAFVYFDYGMSPGTMKEISIPASAYQAPDDETGRS